MKKFLSILIVACTIFCGNLHAQRITVTLAGNGIAGFNGDGQAGYLTEISTPYDVCVDAAGNIYFSDLYDHRIRKISATNGTVSTVAGGGTSAADGIPATSATITPYYMCIDIFGNLYFSTTGKIRKIDASTGNIYTIAGTGTPGYSGDGGAATLAKIQGSNGICVDASGNIYIADGSNYRIRKVTASTGTISTIAGTGVSGSTGDGGLADTATLITPSIICISIIGDIFIADADWGAIRKISGATGVITTIAGSASGGGSGVSGVLALGATLGDVTGMCVDTLGNLFLNEISCSCREINMSTGYIYYVGGDFSSESFADGINSLYAWMDEPNGIFVDGKGNLYVADYVNNRIRKLIQLTHTPSFAYGTGQFIYPCSGISVPVCKQLAITDTNRSESITWSVISNPANGSLSGFPYTKPSNGTDSLTIPAGTAYTSFTGYTGSDSFRVKVTNGTLSDTITIYVQVGVSSLLSISGPNRVCAGSTIGLTTIDYDGIWSTTNSNATALAGVITGITAGIDTIIFTPSGVCGTTAIVTVNPVPDAGIISGNDTLCVGATTTMTESMPGGTWSSDITYYATVGASTGIATGVRYGGITTISYSVSNGFCTSITTFAITTMTSADAISMVSGTTSICTMSSTTIYDDISGGVWSSVNGNAIVAGLSGSTYDGLVTGVRTGVDTILYTNTNRCGTSTVQLTVNVIAGPNTGVITGNDTVCIGSSITLADTIVGGTWSRRFGYAAIGTTGIVTGVNYGIEIISYSVTDATCTSSTTKTISVLNPAGAITGPTAVCRASSVTLSDLLTGGIWSVSNARAIITPLGSDSLIVSGITPGLDSIIYTNTNMCGTAILQHLITIDTVVNPGIITAPASLCSGSLFTSLSETLSGGDWSVSNTHASILAGIYLQGVSAGVDTIIYTYTNACSTVNTYSILTINPTPVVGIIAGLDLVCVGSDITLTDTTAFGVWSSSAITIASAGASTGIISGIANGAVDIYYNVTNAGCSTSVTKVINVGTDAGTIYGTPIVCVGSSISLSDLTTGGTWSVSNGDAAVIPADTYYGVVLGLLAGIDTIIFTNTNPCGTASVTQVVSVNPLPDPGIITGGTDLCLGSSITLSSTVTGGRWTRYNTNATVGAITGVVTGVVVGYDTMYYTVTGSGVSSGCSAITESLVDILTVPTAGTIVGADSVCIGNSIILSDTATGGTWSSTTGDASVASGIVTGVSAGSDSIVYIVTNICGSAVTYYPIIINSASVCGTVTGINNTPNSNNTLYPNPTTSEITISASYRINGISISNLVGQVVFNRVFDAENIQLNVSQLPAGIYFVKINDNEVRRFVKE